MFWKTAIICWSKKILNDDKAQEEAKNNEENINDLIEYWLLEKLYKSRTKEKILQVLGYAQKHCKWLTQQ